MIDQSAHKSFLFPSTPPYLLPSTLPPTTTPYLRSAVALANKATLLHSVLEGQGEEKVGVFEEGWESFLQVFAGERGEAGGWRIHDGMLALMVDFGTQVSWALLSLCSCFSSFARRSVLF